MSFDFKSLPTVSQLQAMSPREREGVAELLKQLKNAKEQPAEPPDAEAIVLTPAQVEQVAELLDALDWRWFARLVSEYNGFLADAAWDRVFGGRKARILEKVLLARDAWQTQHPSEPPCPIHEFVFDDSQVA